MLARPLNSFKLTAAAVAAAAAFLLIGLLAVGQSQAAAAADGSLPDFLNPVQPANEDEVKDLPGLEDAVNFRHYSGYLPADNRKEPKKFFHYWFVESQSNPAKDPVLLWLNGGPGCSSLAGMFTELGPFQVSPDGKTLRANEFSWNKVANVLFLESPAGVGFSYSTNLIDVHTDDSTAEENHQALKSFFQKYPQYKSNSLYLSGESYAGVYLPTLGVLVDQDPELNLKGIAIGNGYLDAGKLTDSLVLFNYYHGLIGRTLYNRLSEHCCAGKPLAREDCKFTGASVFSQCEAAVRDVQLVLDQPGINPYNLYDRCSGQKAATTTGTLRKNRLHQQQQQRQQHLLSRDKVDKALRNLALKPAFFNQSKPFHVFEAKKQLGVEPPCVDDSTLIRYLNQKEVRSAMHIPKNVGSWGTCASIAYVMKYPKLPGGLAPQMKSLISSERNLTMLVYNGDVDTVCNFLGDEWFVDELGRKVIRDYEFWRVNGQVAGAVKHFDGITFVTVRGSGHMVPGDRPQESLEMIKVFLGAGGKHFEL